MLMLMVVVFVNAEPAPRMAPCERCHGRADRPAHGSLSTREREVAALVTEGLTNRQIGERLVITERTVETHLERIFVKLDLQSRAQLASWFLQHPLPMPLSIQPRSDAALG